MKLFIRLALGEPLGGIMHVRLFFDLFSSRVGCCSVSYEKNSIIDLTDTENAILFTTYIK
jgi:hypothetical protein